MRVAFASERHARAALAALRARPDLFASAELNDPSPLTDLALIDIAGRHETRDRIITLTQGMHGIIVSIGGRPLDAGKVVDPVADREG